SGMDSTTAIALRAALADLPGVHIEASPTRVYGSGDLLPHILGYTGPLQPDQVAEFTTKGYPLDARVGQTGIEAQYETALRGTPGTRSVAASPSGRELARLGTTDAVPGVDVELGIDLRLQRAVTDALRTGIANGAPPGGLNADGKPALRAGA